MSNTIVVVGSLNADLMIHVERHPRPGETLHGTGGEIMPGGKGANQALAAALLGGDVHMVGAVGDDPHAGPATSLLRAAGVDLDHVAVHRGPTGLAVVVVDSVGENNIIVIAGANDSMEAAAVDKAAEVISRAAIVVIQGEIPRSGIERTAELAAGRLVVNLAPVLEVDRSVVLAADPLVVNEHEAALALELIDCPVEAPHGDSGNHGAERAMTHELLRAGVRSVVLTLGADGALVGEAGNVKLVPSPTVSAVDTTGAGDAFVGALATRLARGQSLLDAAAFAARVGAFACTGTGAQPSYPTESDILPEAV
ncbi:MAG: ribokinase [Candidatus Nanopelagicales bacterium]